MHTSNQRIQRNALCPCGSGNKFKHCCSHNSFSGDVQCARPIPGDGASLRPSNPPPKPITRVAISYAIDDQFGNAEVSFCYPVGTFIIMATGTIQPVETLEPGLLFRLEDGGVATVTKIDSPKVWEPPTNEKDANGNSVRRIIGKVKYTGYYPRIDLFVRGDVLKTTPGHLFWSVTRNGWYPAESFHQGEMLRSKSGLSVPVESLSQIFYEFGTLHNLEVEEHHTYFVGGGSHGGILTHNGMEMGCRVPRAAIAERESFNIASGYRINGLRETTMAEMQKAFHGTGLTPTRHFFERASELRTFNQGVRTYGDLQTIIRKGSLVNADRGERALVFNGMAIVFDPKTGRLITLRPW